MVACLVTEAATPYRVSVDTCGDHRRHPVVQNVINVSNLPTYPTDAPVPEQAQVLAYIADEGPVSKRTASSVPRVKPPSSSLSMRVVVSEASIESSTQQ
ncbi:MAG: hypothetical protein ACI9HI_001072 [Salinirussus sp.]|jgi:hypothetical protein